MGAMRAADGCACRLAAPERNRYFHGQMLYDRNFRLETDYHNLKRSLVNRLVVGWGVVCGLGVRACEDDEPAIIIEPGVALDRCGREIVVDEESGPHRVPARLLYPPEESDEEEPGYEKRGYEEPGREGRGYEKRGNEEPEGERPEREERYGSEEDQGYRAEGKGRRRYGEDHAGNERRHYGESSYGDERRRRHRREIELHVVLCYHECTAGPTPVLAGDCRDEEPCQPGLIRERYALEFRPGCLPPRRPRLKIPDVISPDGKLDYEALVQAVSKPCPCPEDPCIPLANLRLDLDPDSHRCHEEVDLSIRPIVYTNDLLLQLILSAVLEAPSYRSEK